MRNLVFEIRRPMRWLAGQFDFVTTSVSSQQASP